MSDTPSIRPIRNRSDRQAFTRAALRDLTVLEEMLKDGAFEAGKRRLGAEQELDFLDEDFRPAALVPDILEHLDDGPYVTEYAKFNLEINSAPHEVKGGVFGRLRRELQGHLDHVGEVAQKHFKARTMLTGLLPTIRRHDVRPEALTPSPRYRTMLELVNRLRGKEYEFHIQGIDELVSRDNPSVFGGTFTSFQIHCQSEADLLPAHYNWAQMISAPVLAAATNSPLFLNRRLWRETRIALFAQTTDTRRPESTLRGEEPRVSFGRDWVRGDILDLFREDLTRFRPHVTHLPPEATGNDTDAGKLEALNFHLGTVYRWNRMCFATGATPHLRIENRILPAGPTLIDELANTAFWLGLMLAMPEKARHLPETVPFSTAHANFNRAARSGLGVTFEWFGQAVPAQTLILEQLLPLAREGLDAYGVDPDESGQLLGIIADRVSSGQTGSEWILNAFESFRKDLSAGESSVRLTAEMAARAENGEPVHTWEPAARAGSGININFDATWTVEQIMQSDLIVLHPDDSWDYASRLMTWNDRAFLPVVDNDEVFRGVVSRRDALRACDEGKEESVSETLRSSPVGLPLEASIEDCLRLMREEDIGCVAVLEGGSLAGLVTNQDVVRVAPNMLQSLPS